jgi:integrase
MYSQSAQKRHVRFLTRDGCARLIRALPTKHLKLAARLAVWTGLGMRSMLQLTWDRIDLDDRRLWLAGDLTKMPPSAKHLIIQGLMVPTHRPRPKSSQVP